MPELVFPVHAVAVEGKDVVLDREEPEEHEGQPEGRHGYLQHDVDATEVVDYGVLLDCGYHAQGNGDKKGDHD